MDENTQGDFILKGKIWQAKTLLKEEPQAGLQCNLHRVERRGEKRAQRPYHDDAFDFLIAVYWQDSFAHVWGPIPMAVLAAKGLVKTETQPGKTSFYVHTDELPGACKQLSSGVLGRGRPKYGWTKQYFAGSVDCGAWQI